MENLAVAGIIEDYMPRVVPLEISERDYRGIEAQLASLRLYDLADRNATVAGILLFSDAPETFVPGALVEYARFDSHRPDAKPIVQTHFRGSLLRQLDGLETFLKGPSPEDVPASEAVGRDFPSLYPERALRELIVNSVMHRAYNGTNAPTRISHFLDRIEIHNPGGLFGSMRPENLRCANDYRNPTIATALQAYEYVERFGTGLNRVAADLEKNGNPPAEFDVGDRSYFRVTVRRRL